MDCFYCRKPIKKTSIWKCIPCDKTYHPGCIGKHRALNQVGQFGVCDGESIIIPVAPGSPTTDIFVDASSSVSSVSVSVSSDTSHVITTTTTTATTTTTTATASTHAMPMPTTALPAAWPSYRASTVVLPPAPTTELSQLCADVRAVLLAQGDVKTILQQHSVQLKQFNEFAQEQKAHNAHIENAITALTAEINGKLHAVLQNQTEINSRVNDLETTVTDLKAQFCNFQACPPTTDTTAPAVSANTVRELSVQMHQIQQEQVTCSVLVSGLPEVSNEDLVTSILHITEVLKVQVTSRDIVSVRRLPSSLKRSQQIENHRGKPRAILLKFTTTSVKSLLLSALRQKGRLLTTDLSDTPSGTPGSQIRLNDFLPKEIWLLLKVTRSAAREGGYKYCWHSRGSILVKKDTDSIPIRITSESDIDSKMP